MIPASKSCCPTFRSSQWLRQQNPAQREFPAARWLGAWISLLLVVSGFSAGLVRHAEAADVDPVYQWHAFCGSYADWSLKEEGKSIAVAADGSIYVTGYSYYSWNGPGGAPPLNPHAGLTDIFVVKLNSAGAYQWHTFHGSTDDDCGQRVAVAADGSVYVTGYSYDNWNGPGEALPKNKYAGGSDIVVVKLDSAGTYQWHTFYGSSGDDLGHGIAVAANGSVHVTGKSDAAWNGRGGALPRNPHAGRDEIVVIKLSGTGDYQWHTFHGGNGYETGLAIAVDKSGGLYIAGGGERWNGPGNVAPLEAYVGGGDIVILKLDGVGTYQWHAFYGSSGSNDNGRGIVLDKDGGIYVAGFSGQNWKGPGGVAPLNPCAGASGEIVVIKLSGTGAYQWHTFHGSTYWDEGKDIAVDSSGGVYVTGESWKTWDGPGGLAPLNPHTGNYSYNMLILKLNSAGIYQFHTFYGSSEGESNGNGIAVDTGGGVYLTGYSAAAWKGPGGVAPVHNYANGYDIVIVKAHTGISSPPQVTLKSPEKNSGVSHTAITFKWNATDLATKYQIQIRLADNRIFKDHSLGNVLQFTEGGFPNDGTAYKWRVRAGNAEGWGPWSTYWSIANGKPPRVTVTSPANHATIAGRAVVLSWNAARGASKYQVKIKRADGSVFKSRILGNKLRLRQTGFPNNGASYKWQVRAGNAAGWGPYSSKRIFTNGR
jgi:hypothetical protein